MYRQKYQRKLDFAESFDPLNMKNIWITRENPNNSNQDDARVKKLNLQRELIKIVNLWEIKTFSEFHDKHYEHYKSILEDLNTQLFLTPCIEKLLCPYVCFLKQHGGGSGDAQSSFHFMPFSYFSLP